MPFTLLLLLLIPAITFAQAPFALVELFTSEGCSSCPAADALLSDIKKNSEKNGQNIIILEYHVDYWNKLGWKDPYSKVQYTIRQENYSRVLPGKEMFTPQAVVNGTTSIIGSDKKQMKESINTALIETPKYNLSVQIDSTVRDTAFISYNFSVFSTDLALRLALTEDDLNSKVDKGENAGKTLHHDNVVRYFYSIDSPQLTGHFKLPLNVFTGTGPRKIVAFVQQKKKMIVVAGTKIKINHGGTENME